MTNPNTQPILAIVYVTGSDAIPESAELPTLSVFSDNEGNHIDEAELAPVKEAIEQACDRLDVAYRFVQFYRIDRRLGTQEDAFFHALRLKNPPGERRRQSGQS